MMGDRQQATGYGQITDAIRNLLVMRRLPVAAVVCIGMALGGCGNIEPWVKPYERQQLADPIMSFDANPVSKAYMDHVFEAREGSRGGLGSAGGGCGCN